MKLTTEHNTIRNTWNQIHTLTFSDAADRPHLVGYDDAFKVYNRNMEQVRIPAWGSFYVCPEAGVTRIALRINKSHWAKGRKMTVESLFEGIPSGEYVIVDKAETNSYDSQDFLVIEYCAPALDTPRKAMNWLEKRIKELEAKDGLTTEKIIQDMRVRG